MTDICHVRFRLLCLDSPLITIETFHLSLILVEQEVSKDDSDGEPGAQPSPFPHPVPARPQASRLGTGRARSGHWVPLGALSPQRAAPVGPSVPEGRGLLWGAAGSPVPHGNGDTH